MNRIWLTCLRTLGIARNRFSTALLVSVFLSMAAVAFALMLMRHEGDVMSVVSIWALSIAYLLPALSVLLTMDVWSDERHSGRIDMLLSTAVRERDYVIGKFLGVWVLTMVAVLVSLLSSLSSLAFVAPKALEGVRLTAFAPALLILGLQIALWCAVSGGFSAAFRRSAAAACASLVFLALLPRVLWEGTILLSGASRVAFGEMPFDAHVLDFASGMVSFGATMSYLALTVAALFITSKLVLQLRLVGRGARMLRASSRFSMLLSLVAATLAVLLALRLDVAVDMQTAGSFGAFSHRTREILAEAGSGVTATAYLPRNDSRFRAVGQFLRALRREALAAGASRFNLRFVDPRWDLGAAETLVGRGVVEDCIVFEKGRRLSTVPLKDGYGERVCASAIRRLITSPQRRQVYWTTGHGEFAFGEYGSFGMSDVARELTMEGFRNGTIDLNDEGPVPSDCALIVIAGAKHDFSRAELDRLQTYLQGGGRLLVLQGRDEVAGISSTLLSWGVRQSRQPIVDAKTIDGRAVMVSDFSSHEVAEPLRGSRIVMVQPVAFESSAVAGTGVDCIEFSPIASVGSAAVAVTVSRGTGIGSDLAIRPTRIVVIGDAGFATNGALSLRANANRDFFLNCIAYLAGTDSLGAAGTTADQLVLGLSRELRLKHVAVSALAVPALVFLVMMAVACHRRRRT